MKHQLFITLRAEIDDLHDVAENHSPLHRIVKGNLSSDEYVEILKHLYSFAAEIELSALDAIKPHVPIDKLTKLSRMPALKRDLCHFDIDTSNLEYTQDRMQMKVPAQAIGWLYLSEGSRLGGQVLSQALKEQFGFDHSSGAAYFSSDGDLIDKIQDQWEWFQKMTVDLLATEAEKEITIKTARDCFQQLNDWFNDLKL